MSETETFGSLLEAFCSTEGDKLQRDARHRDAETDFKMARQGAVEVWVEANALRIEGARRPEWHEKGIRGDRAPCVTFSSRARSAMLWFLATLKPDAMPIFYTFTLPRECDLTPAQAKEKLFDLLQRWERRFGVFCTLWKMEPQADGTPHFHCMTWGVPFHPWQEVACEWTEVVTGVAMPHPPVIGGSAGAEIFRQWLAALVEVGRITPLACKMAEASTRVEAIKTRNGISFYASKYCAKVIASNWEKPGRFWGVRGRAHAPVARQVRIETTAAAVVKLKRTARRWLRSKGIKHAMGAKLWQCTPLQWLRCLVWAEGLQAPVHDFYCDDGALAAGQG